MFYLSQVQDKNAQALRADLMAGKLRKRELLPTFLNFSCFHGDHEAVRALGKLPDNIRPDLNPRSGWPLKLAVASGSRETMEAIVGSPGFDCSKPTELQIQECLYFAACEKKPEGIDFLMTWFPKKMKHSFVVSGKCSGRLWESLVKSWSISPDGEAGLNVLLSWTKEPAKGLPPVDWQKLLSFALEHEVDRLQYNQVSLPYAALAIMNHMPVEIIFEREDKIKRTLSVFAQHPRMSEVRARFSSLIKERDLFLASGHQATGKKPKI